MLQDLPRLDDELLRPLSPPPNRPPDNRLGEGQPRGHQERGDFHDVPHASRQERHLRRPQGRQVSLRIGILILKQSRSAGRGIILFLIGVVVPLLQAFCTFVIGIFRFSSGDWEKPECEKFKEANSVWSHQIGSERCAKWSVPLCKR